MSVVSLVVELRLIGCETSRQKRSRTEKILGKLRRHLNVAVADLGREEPSELAVLGFAAVGRTRKEAREILERVAEALASHPSSELVRVAFDEL